MSRAREFADLAGSASAGGITGRNIIINGAMQVAQRATSVASLSSTATYSTCDRWEVQYGSSGTFTESQSTTAPDGFSNSLKLDCTTADASPNYLVIMQRIEGQNLQSLKKGTSAAESTTLSFYVRSSKTGTYQVNLLDNDNTRIIGATYTISSANTWEFKSITFAGDTTGTFDNDNNNSLQVEWWLASGSTYNSGAVPTAWEAMSNGDRAAGLNVAIGASTSDDFHLAGVQFELGEKDTPFEHRSFADELQRCQRYFAVRENTAGSLKYYGQTLQAYGSSSVYGLIADYPVTMRTTPTVSQSGTFGAYTASSANNNMNSSIQNLFASSHAWGTGGWTGDSNLVAGYASVMYANTNAKLMADAEL